METKSNQIKLGISLSHYISFSEDIRSFAVLGGDTLQLQVDLVDIVDIMSK